MIRRARAIAALAPMWFLFACASSGGSAAPPVPVYFDPAVVPCAYEVVGPVREEVDRGTDVERAAQRVFGRAGARRGADAVLMDRTNPRLTVERMDMNQGLDPRITLEAVLLRYSDPGCGSPAAR
jgi:hypothetical protein